MVKNRMLKGDLKAIIPTIQLQVARYGDPEMEITQVCRCSGQEAHLCSNNTMGYITEGSVKCYGHKDEGATDFP